MKIRILLLSLTFIFQSHIIAQITNISGIINKYSPVNQFDKCLNTLVVDSPQNFNINDKVLLIQMKGASISTGDNITYGEISDLKSCGNFEINEVSNKVGNTIYLKYAVQRAYDVFGKLQLISIPEYITATTNGPLTAQSWNGNTGGVLIMKTGILNLNDSIDLSGKGFRGAGTVNSPTCFNNGVGGSELFRCDSITECGAAKGEGITDEGLGYGRGPRANGGGGGNDHNAGGGGGANYGFGGIGGVRTNTSNFNCPGPGAGLSGKGLQSGYLLNKIFMGGGGGAGDENNSQGSSGGAGGGICIIIANQINSNGVSINVSGVHQNLIAGNDGAGGGGAGGSILLKCPQFSGNLYLDARGGKGGSLNTGTSFNNYCMGPGGGGGGGHIQISGNNWPANLSFDYIGGPNGVNLWPNNPNNCPFGSSNLATPGFLGDTALNGTITEPSIIFKPLISSISLTDTTICPGQPVSININADATYPPLIVWSTGNSGSSITISPESNTQIIANVQDNNFCTQSYVVNITASQVVTTITAQPDTAILEGNTVLLSASGNPTWLYQWSPANTLADPDSQLTSAFPLETTVYCVTATNQYQCTAQSCITIPVIQEPEPVDTAFAFALPDAFSPNNDSKNDKLVLLSNIDVNIELVRIYNRWGEIVYESQKELNWDGKYKSKDQPEGVYYCFLKFKSYKPGAEYRNITIPITLIR